MSLTCRLLFCVITAAVLFKLPAAEQGIPFHPNPNGQQIEASAIDNSLFLTRFESAFAQRANDQFADRFQMLAEMKRHRMFSSDDPNGAGLDTRESLLKSLSSSARDAAIELPVMRWFEERQGMVADFLRGALQSSGEDAVDPMSLASSYTERSWWRQLASSESMFYGIRPFRTDPYAFVSLRIKDGNSLLALAHARYHFQQFAEHHFELALSVPVARGLAIDVGSSYQFGNHSEQKQLAVKLLKEFKNGGYLQAGMRLRHSPVLFVGMSLPL